MNVEPLVSIGLPVYNASHFMQAALDALLAQTYTHFELIISDNASTDDTWSICQDYAGRDSRIKLYRNDSNRGAAYNFVRVFELASGQYFMWAAHDDSWYPDFVAACVEKLESAPEAVLCYTDQLHMEVRTGMERVVSYKLAVDNPVFSRRASALLISNPIPYAIIYGLYRREKMIPAFPFPRTVSPDLFFLLKVARYGTFVSVPRTLYRRRVQRKEFRVIMKSIHPTFNALPRFLVYAGLMLRLWGFAWSSGESLVGKIRIALAGTRFAGIKIIVYLIPDGIRRALRGLVPSNRLSAKP